MVLKRIGIVLFLIFFLLPNHNLQAQDSNAGFVPGNIWYSQDPFEEGDKIKIYTVLFNPDSREFSGTVIFFDKTTFLGKKDFKVAPRSVQDISIDWTVNVGEHIIFAKIENAKFLVSPGKYEEVYLSGNQTEESKRTVKKKITISTTSENIVNNLKGEILDASSGSIENIGNTVKENTPDIIAQPIISTVNSLEDFRNKVGGLSVENKETIKKELQYNKENPEDNNKLETPFRYIKLFFFTLTSFIFNQKIIFYFLIVIILFYILRYIWRLIF
ncbi:hypothetical protein COU49_00045 [Candidatus Nomurabacteria bacterium CG10_big_fil_rev_8_21_14_0_10_35_16]|uniref:Uncharacterized protein n=1 Tax=Candidatus Nomurabacteria bacterium CG10_big_fil_rev_8_21_14_0_10_35_16 TaxID=1974731 RepID=A0A2H0TC76_9BACT|nr:MAG: hypothetical protein COU49_00045 [Candidatus Nomurabacteria bacterium CG10_big_fil_rev_8_21_14_0_10_35_16]